MDLAASPPARAGAHRPARLARPALGGVLLAVAFLAAACGSSTPVPPLPVPTLDDYSPAVKDQLRSVLDRAAADPGNAALAGAWGRALYAYGLYEAAEQSFARARALAPKSFEWAYLLGVVRSDRGRFPEAEEALRAAAAIRPDDLPTSLRLADLLEKSGDEQQALRILEAVRQRAPAAAAVYYRLGRLYAPRDRAQASVYLEQALGIEPDYREARYLLANTYTLEGRSDDAKKQLELFEQTDTTPRRHYQDPLLDALVELKTGDARTLYEDALAQQQAGNLRRALELYESTLEVDAAHLQAHVSLIAVHGMLSNFEQAVVHFNRAVALNPDTLEAYYNLGLVRHSAGDPAAAAAAFSKALEINPADAQTHANLGVVLEQLGRGAEAENHFRIALQNDPAAPTANFHLGRRFVERGRAREALPYLEKALAGASEQSAVHAFLALAYRRLGNREQARSHGMLALQQARANGQTELAEQIASELGL